MTPSIRIASLIYTAQTTDRLDAAHPWQRFSEINQAVKRHLSGATASVFARPETAADGSGTVAWYSDLAGQPVPLLDLPADQQAAVRRRLKDQLYAISNLGQELERQDPDNHGLAVLLANAIRYPGDQSVYVVSGAPVLTSWGGSESGRARIDAVTGAATEAAVGPARRRRWPLLLLVSALVATLLIGGWMWHGHQTRQDLQAALDAALANQCQPTAPLVELSAWLDRIDPDAERYPEIHMGVLTEAGICDEAAGLAARLAEAEQCSTLPALEKDITFYDLEREPFKRLKADLETRLAACRRIQGLEARLVAATGDCSAVAGLEPEISALDPGTLGAEGLRVDLDRALAACRLAGDLGPRVGAAAGDCARLRDLSRDAARELADHDPSGDPLREVAETLDSELTRCDLADHLERELAKSQEDCLALAGLKDIVSRNDEDREPLAAMGRQLEVALSQCAALDELERNFAEANGDCARIEALTEGLGDYRNNLRFLDIRMRLRQELEVCGRASALEDQIAAAGGDCAKAREVAASLTDTGDPRFAKAHAALKRQLADCDRVERYTRLLAEAGEDCTGLKALERDLKRESAKSLGPIRQRLDKAMDPCRPKPKPPVLLAKKPRPTIAAEKTPKDSGSFAMRGGCTGRLLIEPSSGWDGDGVRHIVSIDPPASTRVARVASTNPGCRNCRLRKVGANVWRGDLRYRCGGRGIVHVSYAAYDNRGQLICSGNGSDLCLGRR